MSSSPARRTFVASLALTVLALPLALRARAADRPVIAYTGAAGGMATGEQEENRLWDQTVECGARGVSSQEFTDLPVETECADDFVVPPAESWLIQRVFVDGAYFNGSGPADAVNVVFYADDAGLPGDEVETFGDLIPIAGLGDGNFLIQLPKTLFLTPGRYWVSVQAVMSFDSGGQWFWQVRGASTELERVFRNPDDSFGSGCTDFDRASNCPGTDIDGDDHCFALIGEVCEGGADLEIDKTASSSRVPVGERLTFFLHVKNNGPEDAFDVDVEDLIPDVFDIVSVRRPSGWTTTIVGNLVKVEKDVLLVDEEALIEIEVRALRARQAVENKAEVESDLTPDCNPENNDDRVTVRIHGLSDPGVPTLSTLGLALLALLMGAALLRFGRGAA